MKYFIIFFVFSLVNSNDFINVKELDIQSKSELKKYMKIISKDLGVKCNHCHDLEDKSIMLLYPSKLLAIIGKIPI